MLYKEYVVFNLLVCNILPYSLQSGPGDGRVSSLTYACGRVLSLVWSEPKGVDHRPRMCVR